ncbi:MAG: phosphatidate cytidylyltransferase [Anaerolineales bacterium]|nr:phosphatidate cytidylyltransferase [Anaerolineales bacterium]
MLPKRAAVALLLIPLVMWVIADGQWLFFTGLAFVLSLAVLEFASLYKHVGRRPAAPLMVAGVLALSISRFFSQFEYDALIVGGFCILAMAWHVREFEMGIEHAGSDFALSVAGFIYVGWVGSYLILLRRIPDGLIWFMIVLPSIWMADSAAYLVGKAIGKHRLAPRTSPKKSWEGYLAGIVGGMLGGALFLNVLNAGLDPQASLDTSAGMIVGAAVGVFGPIGDLGVSMLKREVGRKDSGRLLPGHGGALDRMDSWFWAAFIGFHLIIILSG